MNTYAYGVGSGLGLNAYYSVNTDTAVEIIAATLYGSGKVGTMSTDNVKDSVTKKTLERDGVKEVKTIVTNDSFIEEYKKVFSKVPSSYPNAISLNLWTHECAYWRDDNNYLINPNYVSSCEAKNARTDYVNSYQYKYEKSGDEAYVYLAAQYVDVIDGVPTVVEPQGRNIVSPKTPIAGETPDVLNDSNYQKYDCFKATFKRQDDGRWTYYSVELTYE